MKKILVPTDFSDCANAAAQVAMIVAKKAGAELYFLHMHMNIAERWLVPFTESTVAVEDDRQTGIKHAKAALNKLVTDATRQGINARQELILNEGEARLEEYIEPFGIDLVIMGSNGVRGLKEMIIGSNTQRLIWKSPVPVLVIKTPPETFELKNIAFVSNFELDHLRPFHAVVALASLWKANIHLLYINTPLNFRETSDVLTNMKRYMHQFHGVAYTPHIYDALDPERGIHHFAKSHNIDLLGIATTERSGLVTLTHSVAECLVNHEQIPVLAINIDK
jgi:nucleotide-binding universal stress UspA family protein